MQLNRDMRRVSFWNSVVLSAPIVLASMACSFAASSIDVSQPKQGATTHVSTDDDGRGKRTFISAIAYPLEPTALFDCSVKIREADEETPADASLFSIFEWTLFVTGFFFCAYWFQRLVPSLASST